MGPLNVVHFLFCTQLEKSNMNPSIDYLCMISSLLCYLYKEGADWLQIYQLAIGHSSYSTCTVFRGGLHFYLFVPGLVVSRRLQLIHVNNTQCCVSARFMELSP